MTGIDVHHYEDYCAVCEASGIPVWLLFEHTRATPDARDIRAGCPRECPTGLFGNSLDYLREHENHRHENWGPHGMVYWAVEHLRLLAGKLDESTAA